MIRYKKSVKNEKSHMKVHAQIEMICWKKNAQFTILIQKKMLGWDAQNILMTYLSTNNQYAWGKKARIIFVSILSLSSY